MTTMIMLGGARRAGAGIAAMPLRRGSGRVREPAFARRRIIRSGVAAARLARKAWQMRHVVRRNAQDVCGHFTPDELRFIVVGSIIVTRTLFATADKGPSARAVISPRANTAGEGATGTGVLLMASDAPRRGALTD